LATTLESAQIAEAHRYVDIFRDQIEKRVRDVQIDADRWVRVQEPGEELQEGVVDSARPAP
jgi:hypothetical protein